MNDDKEKLLAKKIVNILGKQPEVSHDISARLEKSREKALAVRKVNFYTQANNTLVIPQDPLNVPLVWLGMVAIAIIFAFIQISGNLGSTLGGENDYRMSPDRIQYHMNAEMIDAEFLSDENLNEPINNTSKDTI